MLLTLLKFLGLCSVFLCSLEIGFLQASKIKMKRASTEDAVVLMQHIKEHLLYGKEPIVDILNQIKHKHIFHAIRPTAEILSQGDPQVIQHWLKLSGFSKHLPKSSHQILLQTLLSIGKNSSESGINQLRYQIERFTQEARRLKEKEKEDKKLCLSCGIYTGGILVLLML